ncbi:MAG: hypothetical protein O7E52_21870 [Candidatus Poribacteria bacterium]|nr:hypothetical protein [Candidatus Poribacteria bacterium]
MSDQRQSEDILKIIEETSEKVDRRVKFYRQWNAYLLVINLIASTVATLLAGGMAAKVADRANRVGGWQIGCGIVAALTAIATITSGLYQRLKTSDHLTSGVPCSAQLKALRFSLLASETDINDVKSQYRKILEKYGNYIT